MIQVVHWLFAYMYISTWHCASYSIVTLLLFLTPQFPKAHLLLLLLSTRCTWYFQINIHTYIYVYDCVFLNLIEPKWKFTEENLLDYYLDFQTFKARINFLNICMQTRMIVTDLSDCVISNFCVHVVILSLSYLSGLRRINSYRLEASSRFFVTYYPCCYCDRPGNFPRFTQMVSLLLNVWSRGL